MYKLDELDRGVSPLAFKVALVTLAASVWLALAPSGAFAFTQEQVNRGQEVFRLQCARCHGPNGQGVSDVYKGLTAPQLIGPGALTLNPRPYQKMRHFQFRTALNIYQFASAVMPADQPASLNDQDYWDVIAYVLNSDGATPNGQPLTEQSAARMSLAPLQQRLGESGGAVVPALANGGGTGGPNTPVIEGQGK
jgi:cytochrome c